VIDQEVTVQDQLPRLVPGIGKPEPEDDIVQPPLEKMEKILTGNSLLLVRLLEGISELILQKAVDPSNLLFLPKLGFNVREAGN
jgi:hypothetical protein